MNNNNININNINHLLCRTFFLSHFPWWFLGLWCKFPGHRGLELPIAGRSVRGLSNATKLKLRELDQSYGYGYGCGCGCGCGCGGGGGGCCCCCCCCCGQVSKSQLWFSEVCRRLFWWDWWIVMRLPLLVFGLVHYKSLQINDLFGEGAFHFFANVCIMHQGHCRSVAFFIWPNKNGKQFLSLLIFVLYHVSSSSDPPKGLPRWQIMSKSMMGTVVFFSPQDVEILRYHMVPSFPLLSDSFYGTGGSMQSDSEVVGSTSSSLAERRVSEPAGGLERQHVYTRIGAIPKKTSTLNPFDIVSYCRLSLFSYNI